MKLRKIIEEYLNTFKVGMMGGSYNKSAIEVFVNPSKKEFMEVAKKYKEKYYVRFIADPVKKRFYIFSPAVYHFDVVKKVDETITGKTFFGSAVREGAKWVVEGSDEGVKEFHKDYDWKWADKYVKDVSIFMKRKVYEYRGSIDVGEEE